MQMQDDELRVIVEPTNGGMFAKEVLGLRERNSFLTLLLVETKLQRQSWMFLIVRIMILEIRSS